MANECYPYYEPGGRLTYQATAAVTGKRFLKITGNRTSGPGLSTTAEGGNYRMAQAGAGEAAVGVSDRDVAINGKGTALVDFGMIVPVTCGADLSAGQLVQSDANGRAIPKAAGITLGRAMTAATNGNDAEIRLFDNIQ